MDKELEQKIQDLKYLSKRQLKHTDKYHQLYSEVCQQMGIQPQEDGEDEQQIGQEDQNIILSQMNQFRYYLRQMEGDHARTNVQSQYELQKQKVFQDSLRKYHHKTEKQDELMEILQDRYINKDQQEVQDKMNVNKVINENNQIQLEKRKRELQYLISKYELIDKTELIKELKFIENIETYQKYYQMIQKQFSRYHNDYVPILDKFGLHRHFYMREKTKKSYQMNKNQSDVKKVRLNEFLNQIYNHQKDFMDFHKNKSRNLKKRALNSKNYLEWNEKKENEQRDRQEKERVKALKAQDFGAYIDLVQKTKNKRILQLLQQTDQFLKQIGAKVKIQKGEGKMDDEDQNEMVDENKSEEKQTSQEKEQENADGTEQNQVSKENEEQIRQLKEGSKIYYNLTHRFQEDIKEQPQLLTGGVLKNYQLIGLKWMVSLYNNKLNGILADEMGLGKTIQTISLFSYIMETKKNYGPFLVVVPLTTLSNWNMEFERWAGSIKKIVYKGSPQMRKQLAYELRNTKWNVCLTTYEFILKDRLVLNKFEWQYIVVDEGHRMKNSRSKFAQTLGQQYNSNNRLLLTGTPLQNNLAELWSLMNFLLPKVFQSCDDFEKWFSMPLQKISGEKDGQLNEEEKLLLINRLHQVLRPFLLRRVKREVEHELPGKVEHIIKVELSSWQKIQYQQIKENGALVYDPSTGKLGRQALMNMMMQLRKICNHPYLFLNYQQRDYFSDEIFRMSGKFELLERIIPKMIRFGHRILIFSQMTQVMDILQLFFKYKGFRHLRLDGNTKAEERAERMKLFNQKDSIYDIFLLSTRAGGLGLNLQTADTVILFDSDWNPQMDLQAQDRAHRIGQKSEVRVFRLVTNTWIEEEIMNKANYKMGLDEIIIQAGLFNQRSTDIERREKLEEMIQNKNQTTQEDNDLEIPTDEQINEYLARTEDEFNEFEQMDQERYRLDQMRYKYFNRGKMYEGDKLEIRSSMYRLTQEEEVPYWIKQKPVDQNEVLIKEYGRGNRMKKNINYVDELTDNQWMRMLEEGIDIDEVIYVLYAQFKQTAKKEKKVEEITDDIIKKVKPNEDIFLDD